MATLTVDGAELIVSLSWLEKLGALRGDVRVPLSAVRSVTLQPHPWSSLRGVRSPGTGIPGMLSLGTRRFLGGRDFAAIHAGGGAVQVDLNPPSAFARITVSVPDAAATIRAVHAATRIQADGGLKTSKDQPG